MKKIFLTIALLLAGMAAFAQSNVITLLNDMYFRKQLKGLERFYSTNTTNYVFTKNTIYSVKASKSEVQPMDLVRIKEAFATDGALATEQSAFSNKSNDSTICIVVFGGKISEAISTLSNNWQAPHEAHQFKPSKIDGAAMMIESKDSLLLSVYYTEKTHRFTVKEQIAEITSMMEKLYTEGKATYSPVKYLNSSNMKQDGIIRNTGIVGIKHIKLDMQPTPNTETTLQTALEGGEVKLDSDTIIRAHKISNEEFEEHQKFFANAEKSLADSTSMGYGVSVGKYYEIKDSAEAKRVFDLWSHAIPYIFSDPKVFLIDKKDSAIFVSNIVFSMHCALEQNADNSLSYMYLEPARFGGYLYIPHVGDLHKYHYSFKGQLHEQVPPEVQESMNKDIAERDAKFIKEYEDELRNNKTKLSAPIRIIDPDELKGLPFESADEILKGQIVGQDFDPCTANSGEGDKEREIAVAQKKLSAEDINRIAFESGDKTLIKQVAGLDSVANSANYGHGRNAIAQVKDVIYAIVNEEPAGYLTANDLENIETLATRLSLHKDNIKSYAIRRDAVLRMDYKNVIPADVTAVAEITTNLPSWLKKRITPEQYKIVERLNTRYIIDFEKSKIFQNIGISAKQTDAIYKELENLIAEYDQQGQTKRIPLPIIDAIAEKKPISITSTKNGTEIKYVVYSDEGGFDAHVIATLLVDLKKRKVLDCKYSVESRACMDVEFASNKQGMETFSFNGSNELRGNTAGTLSFVTPSGVKIKRYVCENYYIYLARKLSPN